MMKKSNILIFLPVLSILVSLIFYNFKLKELYDTREYKSPYRNMVFTPITGIDHLDIRSANALSVSVEHGDKEGVWVLKTTNKRIKKEKSGNKLILDLMPDSTDEAFLSFGSIIVVTKNLKSIETTPRFKGRDSDEPANEYFVSNYVLDQLNLKVAPNVIMFFNNVKVKTFKAVVGNEPQGSAELNLDSSNTIDTAYFDVLGSSMLILRNPKITKVTYNVSDDAEVSLSGKLLEAIRK